jgi:hypothetical protein
LADRTTLVAALLGTLLVAGCGPARETAGRREEAPAGGATATAQSTTGNGVRLPLLTPSNDTDLAGLEGVLEVEGRCLYLTQPGRSQARTLLAFTIPGVRWDEARDRLVAYGKSFAPGQRVLLGGSGTMNPDVHRWTQPPDPSCDTRAVAVVGAIDAAPERRQR